jgi:hypothetical protein
MLLLMLTVEERLFREQLATAIVNSCNDCWMLVYMSIRLPAALGAGLRSRSPLRTGVWSWLRFCSGPEAGANVNAEASPNGGRIYLQAAAEAGHAELGLMLLGKSADVNCPAATRSGGLCNRSSSRLGALQENFLSL